MIMKNIIRRIILRDISWEYYGEYFGNPISQAENILDFVGL